MTRMKPIRIDFAAPSLARTVFHTHPAVWALALVALAMCLAEAVLGWRLMSQRALDQAQLETARARARAPVATPVAAQLPRISEQQAAAINGAVLQLNLPWRALQDAIASATPPAIGLLALEPDPTKRSMKITAEAKTSDEMIAYVEQLKQQELFDGVTLVRHEINDQDPNRPLRFQVEAEWVAR